MTSLVCLPKAVVFDLGKVLLDFDYRVAVRNFQSKCTVSVSELAQWISGTPLHGQFETGLITGEEFYRACKSATGLSSDYAEFKRLYGDIFSPIQPMIDWQARLRAQGIPTYVFSNTNVIAIEYIRQHYPFFHSFTDYCLSYEHRLMKPDAAFYEVVERTSGLQGRDLLYVDDFPPNAAAGLQRGWQTILHESPTNTFSQLPPGLS